MKKIIFKFYHRIRPTKHDFKVETLFSELLMDCSTIESINILNEINCRFNDELLNRLENHENQINFINGYFGNSLKHRSDKIKEIHNYKFAKN